MYAHAHMVCLPTTYFGGGVLVVSTNVNLLSSHTMLDAKSVFAALSVNMEPHFILNSDSVFSGRYSIY